MSAAFSSPSVAYNGKESIDEHRRYYPDEQTLLPTAAVTRARAKWTLCKPKWVAMLFFITVASYWLTGPHDSTLGSSLSSSSSSDIPAVVHFVHVAPRQPDNDFKPLQFDFKTFMAVYSAFDVLKPTQINFWTDVNETMWNEAKNGGDVYTKAILNMPKVTYNYAAMPTHSRSGIEIVAPQHKSDFIRTQVMNTFGGIYLDTDVWVLRDFNHLRKAGFDNVFGRQPGHSFCQGFWMSKPKNAFTNAWVELQETVFDGGWTSHGNDLINKLYRIFMETDYQAAALVLEQNAFFPLSWMEHDLKLMYGLQQKADDGVSVNLLPFDEEKVLEMYNGPERLPDWSFDWRTSYAVHGWAKGVKDVGHLMAEFGTTLSPQYVLSRRSNVARALYPALRRAIDGGYLAVAEGVVA